MTTNATADKFTPSVIILADNRCNIPADLLPEHDGIMEQITFEYSGDNIL